MPAYLKNRKTQKNTPPKKEEEKENGKESREKKEKKRRKETKRGKKTFIWSRSCGFLCKIKELTILKRAWFR